MSIHQDIRVRISIFEGRDFYDQHGGQVWKIDDFSLKAVYVLGKSPFVDVLHSFLLVLIDSPVLVENRREIRNCDEVTQRLTNLGLPEFLRE